jgi:hypothetical protein
LSSQGATVKKTDVIDLTKLQIDKTGKQEPIQNNHSEIREVGVNKDGVISHTSRAKQVRKRAAAASVGVEGGNGPPNLRSRGG